MATSRNPGASSTLSVSVRRWVDFSVVVQNGTLLAPWREILAERTAVHFGIFRLTYDQRLRIRQADVIILLDLVPLLQKAGQYQAYRSLREEKSLGHWWFFLDDVRSQVGNKAIRLRSVG